VIDVPKKLFNIKVSKKTPTPEQAPATERQQDIEQDLAKLRSYLRTKRKKQCTDRHIENQISCIRAIVGGAEHRYKGGCKSKHERFTLQYTEEWLEHVRDNLEASGCKPTTINTYLAALLNLFAATGHDNIHIARVPVIDERDTDEYNCLEKEDVMKIIKAAQDNYRDTAILYTLWSGALRASECCYLQCDDFVVDKDGYGKILVRHGHIKGKKTRTIPIDDDCTRALQDWMKCREENNISKELYPALFPNSGNGNRLTYISIYKIVKKYGRRSGYSNIHCHDFRHARATFLINRAHIPIIHCQKLLGHVFESTTEIYNHTSVKDLELTIYGMKDQACNRSDGNGF
jgi:integrase